MPITPFIEAYIPVTPLTATQSGSLNTSEIDQYRQGVELTQEKFYQLGIVKISAGEKIDQQLTQRQFGESLHKLFPETSTFTEVDRFDPVAFIKQSVQATTASITFPFFVFGVKPDRGSQMDGIIEPLTIRRFAQQALFEPKVKAHSVKGNIEAGNFNRFSGGDLVVTRQKFADKTVGLAPFNDNLNTFSVTPISIDFFSSSLHRINPFDDSQTKSGVFLDSSMDTLIASAALSMHPASDGYVQQGYQGNPSGNTWQNTNGIQIDSTAFGNFTYRNVPRFPELDGFQLLFPRTSISTPTVWNCGLSASSTVVLKGDPNRLYSLVLRFRGVIEQKTFTGGTNDGAYFQTGGTPAGDNFNVYSMTVSDPAQTFYLNRGTSGMLSCFLIDYQERIQVKGGATIILSGSSIDGQEVANQDGSGANPFSVPGITSPTQPYTGQFIQINVVNVS